MSHRLFLWIALALVGTLTGCAEPRIAPPALPTHSIVHDIPRTDRPTIDASAWPAHAGLQINIMSPTMQTPVEKSPTARIAYDTRGLHVWVSVTDTTPMDADPGQYMKDSVEFFIGRDDTPAQRYQVVITPGTTQKNPTPRIEVIDSRVPKTAPDHLATPDFAVAKRVDGYDLEVLMPWSNLGMTPAGNLTLRFQLLINDKAPANSMRWVWYPSEESWRAVDAMQTLRLADHAGPAVDATVAGRYESFRRTVLQVRAVPGLAGKTATVYEDGRIAASAMATLAATADGHSAEARLMLPFPATPFGPLNVSVDGRPIARFTLPKAPDPETAFDETDFRFDPFVFTGTQFPKGDFEDPVRVEDLIGPYSVNTEFYDRRYQPVKTAEKPGRYGAVVTIRTTSGKAYKRYLTLYRAPQKIDWRSKEMQLTVELPKELGIDPVTAHAQMFFIADEFKWALRNTIAQSDYWAALFAWLAETPPDSPRALQRTGPWVADNLWWGKFHMEVEHTPYRYLAYTPAGYLDAGSDKFPLMIFLHGSGEKGLDINAVRTRAAIPARLENKMDLPFLVIAPQCPPRQHWNPWMLKGLIEEVSQKYRVDPDRIYLTGLSMGGFGTWDTAIAFPDLFAAIVPICGYGDKEDVARIANLPTWVFHGDADATVPIKPDTETVEALRQAHGRVRYTIFHGVGHNSWDAAYAMPDLYTWMLQQKRGVPAQPPATAPAQ